MGGKSTFLLIALMLLFEWTQTNKKHALEFSDMKIGSVFRWTIYLSLIVVIFWFAGDQQEFIYFQF